MDRARAKNRAKRGNVAVHVNFDDAPEIASDSRDREMVAIDDALNELAEQGLQQARRRRFRNEDPLHENHTFRKRKQ